jgi:hypothetical protein
MDYMRYMPQLQHQIKAEWRRESSYDNKYDDGSGIGGYYVSDSLTFDEFHGEAVTYNSCVRVRMHDPIYKSITIYKSINLLTYSDFEY